MSRDLYFGIYHLYFEVLGSSSHLFFIYLSFFCFFASSLYQFHHGSSDGRDPDVRSEIFFRIWEGSYGGRPAGPQHEWDDGSDHSFDVLEHPGYWIMVLLLYALAGKETNAEPFFDANWRSHYGRILGPVSF